MGSFAGLDFKRNEAMSSPVGYLMHPNLKWKWDQCQEGGNFIVTKSRSIGAVFFFNASNIGFRDGYLLDNIRGISAQVSGKSMFQRGL